MKKVVIGITGTIASGKGYAATFFHEKGFEHHSASLAIRAIAKERKITINRANLSKLGSKLQKEDPLAITKRVAKLIAGRKKYFVVDGIRTMKAVNFYKKHFDFYLIGIDAPIETRFERVKSRGRKGDPKTLSDFKKIDKKEMAPGGGQEVGKCLKAANILIENCGSQKDFEKSLRKSLSIIKYDINNKKN